MRKGSVAPRSRRMNAAVLLDSVFPPDSRAKRLAMVLDCSHRQARRIIQTGHVPPTLWERFVSAVRKLSAENAQRVEAITLELKALEYEEVVASRRAGRKAALGTGVEGNNGLRGREQKTSLGE